MAKDNEKTCVWCGTPIQSIPFFHSCRNPTCEEKERKANQEFLKTLEWAEEEAKKMMSKARG